MYHIICSTTIRASMAHTKGELRRTNDALLGNPQKEPEGWIMEFNASGTSAQKADVHDTVLGVRTVSH
jgi:hypothetical protein